MMPALVTGESQSKLSRAIADIAPGLGATGSVLGVWIVRYKSSASDTSD
jgi:flagellar motor component MotA